MMIEMRKDDCELDRTMPLNDQRVLRSELYHNEELSSGRH